MKKISTLVLMLMCAIATWAYDFEVDGIYYNILTDKTNEVEVTVGSPRYMDSVAIPKAVTYNGTTYSVTSIGESAFESCDLLLSVYVPDCVTIIKDWAFFECTSLTSVNIPSSVVSIGDYAFNICYSLTSIAIPSSVVTMGFNPFAHCSSLLSIVVDKENTVFDSRENCNAIIETATNTLISGCKNTIIPNSVIAIGAGAFGSCNFANSFLIPNSVTSIGDNAFHYSTSLSSVAISNSITYIGLGAFSYCLSLKEVICFAEELPELGERVFDESPLTDAILYVPEAALELYQTADQWKDFGTILPIEELPAAVENTHNSSSTTNPKKLLRNGQLIILRDGVEYNVMGVRL